MQTQQLISLPLDLKKRPKKKYLTLAEEKTLAEEVQKLSRYMEHKTELEEKLGRRVTETEWAGELGIEIKELENQIRLSNEVRDDAHPLPLGWLLSLPYHNSLCALNDYRSSTLALS